MVWLAVKASAQRVRRRNLPQVPPGATAFSPRAKSPRTSSDDMKASEKESDAPCPAVLPSGGSVTTTTSTCTATETESATEADESLPTGTVVKSNSTGNLLVPAGGKGRLREAGRGRLRGNEASRLHAFSANRVSRCGRREGFVLHNPTSSR